MVFVPLELGVQEYCLCNHCIIMLTFLSYRNNVCGKMSTQIPSTLTLVPDKRWSVKGDIRGFTLTLWATSRHRTLRTRPLKIWPSWEGTKLLCRFVCF